jgi:plastocyanin
MSRKRIVAIVAVALVLAACSSSSNTSTSSSSSSGTSSGKQTVAVQVDAKPTDTGVGYTAYFPNELTVHPGDTVDFNEVFSGEPHTVTFGTLVDQGLAKVDPNASDEPAELKQVPSLLPDGPGDAVQAAAQPCFLASGAPPASDACPKAEQTQPAFDGTQSYYNSGFLADGDHFKVTLADSIKPGTYSFFCTLHRAAMTGKVTVVGASDKAQTAAEVSDAGKKALADIQAKIKPTIDAIKTGTLPPFIPAAAPGSAIAGGGSQDVQAAVPVLFGPSPISIKAGDAVTWTVVGPHTISFGASEALRTFISKAPDGSVHLNPDSPAPAGGAGQPAPDPYAPPPASDAPPTLIDGGSFDGTGFHSSGLVLSFPPALFQYKLTFTKAGTYNYICLVHPDMKGVVNVT